MLGKRVLVIGAMLVSVAAALGFFWPFGRDRDVLCLPGTVETQEVRLSSRTGGRISAIEVREGELVGPGRVLVRLDAPELEAQREQIAGRLAAAQAMLDKANNGARLEEKAAGLASVQAADARLARLKAGSRPEEIEQARNEAEALEADLVRNQQELERERKLHGYASTPAQFDAALASVRRLQGQTRAAQARLKLLQAGSRPEDIAEAEAELARARAQHDLLEAGTRAEDVAHAAACVAELRGKLREIEVQLRETVVAAPEAAVVDIIPVRPGDVEARSWSITRERRKAAPSFNASKAPTTFASSPGRIPTRS